MEATEQTEPFFMGMGRSQAGEAEGEMAEGAIVMEGMWIGEEGGSDGG
jgi:hypothetical protein